MKYLHDIGKYFLMVKISFSKSCKKSILYKQIFKDYSEFATKQLFQTNNQEALNYLLKRGLKKSPFFE